MRPTGFMDVTSTAPRPPSQSLGESARLPEVLEVNVTSATEVDPALQKAIATLTVTAEHHRIGILVTRTGPGSYIVRASPAVPPRIIQQQYE
jgi:hypothetical protein